jgi:hypothetical protein
VTRRWFCPVWGCPLRDSWGGFSEGADSTWSFPPKNGLFTWRTAVRYPHSMGHCDWWCRGDGSDRDPDPFPVCSVATSGRGVSTLGRYDSVGFVDETPAGPVNAQSFGAPGSVGVPDIPVPGPGQVYAAGTEGPAAARLPADTVMVTDKAGPSVTVKWGPDDTQLPGQTQAYGGAADLLTGIVGQGQTGAGLPASWHSHNPNSMNRPVQ